MPFQDLPVELQDMVIDHLHDDIPSLKTCSLVAKPWLFTAKFHLFHDITLVTSPSDPRPTGNPETPRSITISQFFADCSSIWSFVRVLYLKDYGFHFGRTTPNAEYFARMMVDLPNLHSLILSGLAFPELSPNFLTKDNLTLHRLTLSNVSFNADHLSIFLSRFSTVKHLQILEQTCCVASSGSPYSYFPRVTSLAVEGATYNSSESVMQGIPLQVISSSLTTFIFRMSHCRGAEVADAVKMLSNTLKIIGPSLLHLVIDYANLDLREHCLTSWRSLGLSSCTALQSLAICIFTGVMDSMSEDDCMLQWSSAATIISTAPPHLPELTLGIFNTDAEHPIIPPEGVDWESFDKLLNGSRNLRSVRFHIEDREDKLQPSINRRLPFDQSSKTRIVACFPQLHKSGRMSFES